MLCNVLCNQADAVVGIGHPQLFQFRFGNHKQIIEEQTVLSVRTQIQSIQSFHRMNHNSGKIANAHRVTDNHLRQISSGKFPAHTGKAIGIAFIHRERLPSVLSFAFV